MSDNPYQQITTSEEEPARNRVIQMFPGSEKNIEEVYAAAALYYVTLTNISDTRVLRITPLGALLSGDLYLNILNFCKNGRIDKNLAIEISFYLYVGFLPSLLELLKEKEKNDWLELYEVFQALKEGNDSTKVHYLIDFLVKHVKNHVFDNDYSISKDTAPTLICPYINLILSMDPKFDMRRLEFKVEMDEVGNVVGVDMDSVWKSKSERKFKNFTTDLRNFITESEKIRRSIESFSDKALVHFYSTSDDKIQKLMREWLQKNDYELNPKSSTYYTFHDKLRTIQAVDFEEMVIYHQHEAREFLYKLGDAHEIYYFFQTCISALNGAQVNKIYEFLSDGNSNFASFLDLAILRLEVAWGVQEGLESRLEALFIDINRVRAISRHTYPSIVGEISGILQKSSDERKRLLGLQMMSQLNTYFIENEKHPAEMSKKAEEESPIISKFIEGSVTLEELFGYLPDEDKIKVIKLLKRLVHGFNLLEGKIAEFEKTINNSSEI